MNRDKKIKQLKHYYEKVNRFKPSQKQVKEWEALNDYDLTRTYKAWQGIYTKLIFQ